MEALQDNGIEVKIGEQGMVGFIRKGELGRDRSEQRVDRFAVGEKVDAKVTSIDRKSRRVTLSIKQREIAEEKEAMAEYGSADSGASLGDILGAAISKAAQEREAESQANGDEAAASDDAEASPQDTSADAASDETKSDS